MASLTLEALKVVSEELKLTSSESMEIVSPPSTGSKIISLSR